MSGSEEVTRNDDGEIIDQEGKPVVQAAAEQVVARNALVDSRGEAAYENYAAKGAGGQAHEELIALQADQSRPLDDPERQGLQRHFGEAQERAAEASNQIVAADTQLDVNQAADKAHLDANLPEYRQAATELANADLEPRVGEEIPVTKVEEGVIGTTEVAPVDPAVENQDIKTPEVPGPAPN